MMRFSIAATFVILIASGAFGLTGFAADNASDEKDDEPRVAAPALRGTSLASGAKALVCKGEEGFVMFVIPADRKLDSHAVRRDKGWKKLRFASREEVLELTGLAPGSIPPFGSLFGLPTLCDERVGENEVINFNAGDHSVSVSMRYADYIEVERPKLGIVAAELEP